MSNLGDNGKIKQVVELGSSTTITCKDQRTVQCNSGTYGCFDTSNVGVCNPIGGLTTVTCGDGQEVNCHLGT